MAINLVLSENGRRFVVNWTIENRSSAGHKEEFTIRDTGFTLEFFPTSNDNYSLKLSLEEQHSNTENRSKKRKHSTSNPGTAQKKYLQLYPRKVIVTVDNCDSKLMTKISNSQWEYTVSDADYTGDLSTLFDGRRVGRHVHFRVSVDCEPQMKKGESDVINHLGQLLYSGTDSDIQFIVKGEKIPGHKLILRGGSPVLAAMFQHDMREKASGTIEIKDVEPKIFRQMLHFLYTGDAPEVEEDGITEPLFVAADKYQIDSLKNWCGSILSSTLSEENAIHLLVIAHLHSANKLKDECIEFIANNKAFVYAKREEFKQFNQIYPDLFFDVTERMFNSEKKKIISSMFKKIPFEEDSDEY